MKTILILGETGGMTDVCRRALKAEAYHLETVADMEAHPDCASRYQPDLILLNAASQPESDVWDMLLDIKMQNPLLPVVLLFDHAKFLFDERLSQADGYVIIDCFVHEDLRRITARLLRREAVA